MVILLWHSAETCGIHRIRNVVNARFVLIKCRLLVGASFMMIVGGGQFKVMMSESLFLIVKFFNMIRILNFVLNGGEMGREESGFPPGVEVLFDKFFFVYNFIFHQGRQLWLSGLDGKCSSFFVCAKRGNSRMWTEYFQYFYSTEHFDVKNRGSCDVEFKLHQRSWVGQASSLSISQM